eukprot:811007-Alexandrium_andersonii.AAC.1
MLERRPHASSPSSAPKRGCVSAVPSATLRCARPCRHPGAAAPQPAGVEPSAGAAMQTLPAGRGGA